MNDLTHMKILFFGPSERLFWPFPLHHVIGEFLTLIIDKLSDLTVYWTDGLTLIYT